MTVTEFTPLASTIGGALIGAAAVVLATEAAVKARPKVASAFQDGDVTVLTRTLSL